MRKSKRLDPQKHPFLVDDGYPIKLADVRKFNKAWVTSRTENIKPKEVIKSYFFGARKVLQELSKNGAVGIRVYYGFKYDKEKKGNVDALFIVAATENRKDIRENKYASPIGSPKPCPDYCP